MEIRRIPKIRYLKPREQLCENELLGYPRREEEETSKRFSYFRSICTLTPFYSILFIYLFV